MPSPNGNNGNPVQLEYQNDSTESVEEDQMAAVDEDPTNQAQEDLNLHHYWTYDEENDTANLKRKATPETGETVAKLFRKGTVLDIEPHCSGTIVAAW